MNRSVAVLLNKLSKIVLSMPPRPSLNLNCSSKLNSRSIAANCVSMHKQQVYVTRPNIPGTALTLLNERYDVTIWPEECPVPREVLKKQIAGKDALFCLLTDKIDEELLSCAGTSLKVVGTMSVGYDHIDVPALKRRNVKLGFTPDVLTDAVAELTVALLLATSRRLFESHQQIIDEKWGAWSPTWMCGPGLANATVGVVGYGRIGQEVAARLLPFKVSRVLYTSRSEKSAPGCRVSLDTLLAESDFIVVTCALTPETNLMFNKELFGKMKPGAIFVNTSRGGVVDQEALVDALRCGPIRAAGLDVTSPEPLSPDHPLLKLSNCVILPHIGSATTEARAAMAELTARNIIAALDGQPMPAQVI